ncbi:HvfC/BufC N-terminal domain-containing protein [Paraburkholderia bannensis]|uniref:HvfC/BufC N-terminal domain-containing protein n=1 Tax=Paraburkholderia bannensis TaxID=765414 RepID=UPI000485B418|nr:DNA-binding domain-containing protein [Paraburkholderia bannensis]
MNPSLEALQSAFAEAIEDPAADAALLQHLQTADDKLTHERLGLYRGNVRAARRNALASAYPVLAQLTGDAYFDALSLAYARAYPSREADLNRFGASLPEFIERYEADARYAYFGDIARLEWALHAAAFAANAAPLSPAQWQAIGVEKLMAARLNVHPACAALESRHTAFDIWRAHRQNEVVERINIDTKVPNWTLIVRPQWRAAALSQTLAAHTAFTALQCGKTLDEALERAFAIDENFDFATQWRTWIETNAITGLRDT